MTTKLKQPKTADERERARRLRARMNAAAEDYEPTDRARRSSTAVVAAFDPSQPRDADGKWVDGPGGGGASNLLPGTAGKHLSKADSPRRGRRIDQLLRQHRKLATDRTEADWLGPGKGVAWRLERDRIHRQIVDDVYQRAAGVPNEGKAIIMGGPMGAGKTTTVRDHAGVNLDDYLVISPDDMKDELAKRGLVPEIPGHPDVSPLERSTLVHAETMRLAHLLASRAYVDGKNVVWDISMGTPRAVRGHLGEMRRAGYGDVEAIVVDVSPETSRRRAYDRYRAGINDWLSGKGNGGRFIPGAVLADQHDERGRSWGRSSLRQTQELFDRWRVYDNDVDGRDPQLVSEG